MQFFVYFHLNADLFLWQQKTALSASRDQLPLHRFLFTFLFVWYENIIL